MYRQLYPLIWGCGYALFFCLSPKIKKSLHFAFLGVANDDENSDDGDDDNDDHLDLSQGDRHGDDAEPEVGQGKVKDQKIPKNLN